MGSPALEGLEVWSGDKERSSSMTKSPPVAATGEVKPLLIGSPGILCICLAIGKS